MRQGPADETGAGQGGVDGVLGHLPVRRQLAADHRHHAGAGGEDGVLAGEVGGRSPRPPPSRDVSSSGRRPAYAPTTSERRRSLANAAETTSSRNPISGSVGSGTSGISPSTGSSVRPTYRVPSGWGRTITNRLVWPGTCAVTATRRPGRVSPRRTRWVPRDGRRATSSTRSPAQTPVALTTARAVTDAVRAGQLVAELDAGPGGGEDAGAGADVGAVVGGRAGDRRDQPGVVLELAVPGQQAAAKPVAAQAGGQRERLGGRDLARARQGVAAGVRAAPEQVAGDQRAAGDCRTGRSVTLDVSGISIGIACVRCGRGDLHQDPALDRALVGDADLPVGEVAQAAVHELRGPAGGAEREVVGVDGQHASARGVTASSATPAPGDAEPDDDEVDVGRAPARPGVIRVAGRSGGCPLAGSFGRLVTKPHDFCGICLRLGTKPRPRGTPVMGRAPGRGAAAARRRARPR